MTTTSTATTATTTRAPLARRLWPHLVALVALVHLVANCLDALPDPSLGMNRKNWAEPRVRAELDRWAERIGVPRADLEDNLWDVAQHYSDVRKALTLPTSKYLRTIGMRQVWSMFVAGTRTGERVVIQGHEQAGDSWRVLYLQSWGSSVGAGEPTWSKALFDDVRMRSACNRFSWRVYQRSWQRGCQSLARRAFADFPELDRLECSFEKRLAPTPQQAAAGAVVDDDRPVRDRQVVVTRAELPPLEAP